MGGRCKAPRRPGKQIGELKDRKGKRWEGQLKKNRKQSWSKSRELHTQNPDVAIVHTNFDPNASIKEARGTKDLTGAQESTEYQREEDHPVFFYRRDRIS